MRRSFAVVSLCSVMGACSAARQLDDASAYQNSPLMAAAQQARDAAVISLSAEKSLGREAAGNLLAKYGLVADDELQRYANLVGGALARKSARPDLDWRFGVLDSDLPNAYATPGGYVLVTKGLVALLRDEAEFASVLAHEISHVDLKHSIKALRRARTTEAGVLLLNSPADIDAASRELISQLERGHEHDDELEADAEGVLCLARAGYDPAGFLRALKRHSERNAPDPFSARHPPFSKRIAALAALKGVPDSGARAGGRFRTYSATLTRR